MPSTKSARDGQSPTRPGSDPRQPRAAKYLEHEEPRHPARVTGADDHGRLASGVRVHAGRRYCRGAAHTGASVLGSVDRPSGSALAPTATGTSHGPPRARQRRCCGDAWLRSLVAPTAQWLTQPAGTFRGDQPSSTNRTW